MKSAGLPVCSGCGANLRLPCGTSPISPFLPPATASALSLFFTPSMKGALYLASEVKALFAAGVPARWNREAVYYSLESGGCQTRTLFHNVFQVPPGHYLVANASLLLQPAPHHIPPSGRDHSSILVETPAVATWLFAGPAAVYHRMRTPSFEIDSRGAGHLLAAQNPCRAHQKHRTKDYQGLCKYSGAFACEIINEQKSGKHSRPKASDPSLRPRDYCHLIRHVVAIQSVSPKQSQLAARSRWNRLPRPWSRR